MCQKAYCIRCGAGQGPKNRHMGARERGKRWGWMALGFLSKLILQSGQSCCQPGLEPPLAIMLWIYDAHVKALIYSKQLETGYTGKAVLGRSSCSALNLLAGLDAGAGSVCLQRRE